MALFESQFYQPQRINAAPSATTTAGTSNYFPQAFFNNNGNISFDNNNNNGQTPGFYSHHSAAMKRRRELDDSGPLPKRSHYEDRMARRLDSLDLSNENSQSPLSPSVMEDVEDLIIDEVDPEVLTEDSPFSPSNDFEEQPIIEEPEDEDRLVLSDELQRFMKSSDPQNYLSKFQKKKQGTELVLWRPLPSDFNASSSSGGNVSSSSSLNDRITEILDEDDQDADINNEVLPDVADVLNGQSQVITFPDESCSSSNRSSSSPQIIDADPVFSFAHSTSSSSSSSCDGHRPVRMSSNGVLQTDYEPMEMD